jgi:hypothetical protein
VRAVTTNGLVELMRTEPEDLAVTPKRLTAASSQVFSLPLPTDVLAIAFVTVVGPFFQ